MTIIIPPLRPPSPPSPSLLHFLFLVFAATRVSHTGAINLDIHIPLPTGGCVVEEALRANWLLRDASPTGSSSSNSTGDAAAKAPPPALEQPSERIDLFARHTPHITLFLSDFDLEDHSDDGHSNSPSLNRTKLQQFLNAISSLNVTDIALSMDCSLSYTTTTTTTPTSSSWKYYVVSGPYTMLPIQNDPCLRTLSDRIQRALRPFLRRPVVVPSWVASLPEPERSRAIYRCREFGSPNVGEGFVPHVSVGFDPTDGGDGNGDWRIDAMEEWSEGHRSIHGECTDLVGGVAVGMTGEGGTVLAGSRLGYWDLWSAVRMGKDDEGAYNGGHGLRAGDNDVSVVE